VNILKFEYKQSQNLMIQHQLVSSTHDTSIKSKVMSRTNNLHATVILADQLVHLPLIQVLTWRTQSRRLYGISYDSDDFLSTVTVPAEQKHIKCAEWHIQESIVRESNVKSDLLETTASYLYTCKLCKSLVTISFHTEV